MTATEKRRAAARLANLEYLFLHAMSALDELGSAAWAERSTLTDQKAAYLIGLAGYLREQVEAALLDIDGPITDAVLAAEAA